MLCVALYFFFFFFSWTAGWGKNNRKMALVGQAKGQQHPSHLTNTVSFSPIHFPLFVTQLSGAVPCSKAPVRFCLEYLGLQIGKPQPALGQAVGAAAAAAHGGVRIDPADGGEARVLSSPAVVAPSPRGDVGREAVTPHVKSGPNKQNSTSAKEILSRISGTSLFFFRLLDALTHMIFDGRERNICNWQRKTYRPIKKREFSCLTPFQS